MSALTSDDSFKGLVLTLVDGAAETLDGPQFELLYTPISHSRRMQDMEMTKRVWSLEVRVWSRGRGLTFPIYEGATKFENVLSMTVSFCMEVLSD